MMIGLNGVGRVSLGKSKSGNSSSRKFNSKGISFGADKIKKMKETQYTGLFFSMELMMLKLEIEEQN